MGILSKFEMSDSQKSEFRQAFMSIVDQHFDAFEKSYLNAFKALPYEVLERMTDEQAQEYLSLTVKEAVKGIETSMEMLKEQLKGVTNDEEKMARIREEFFQSMKGKAEADVPDVPKNTMKEE